MKTKQKTLRSALLDRYKLNSSFLCSNKLPVEESVRNEVGLKISEAKDIYCRGVLENYALDNGAVREVISGGTTFLDVGGPILDRAEEVYNSIKGSHKGYRFRREEFLGSGECKDSASQLEGIVDLGRYFKNGRIQGKTFKKYFDGLMGDNVLPGISRMLVTGALGLGIASNLPDSQQNGANMAALLFGFPLLSLIPFYENSNSAESLICRPARRLEEDLIWMDEIAEKIYHSGK